MLDGGKKNKGHKKDSREKLFTVLLDRERHAQGDPEREAPPEGEEGEENEESSSSDQSARESEEGGLKLENGEDAISKVEAASIRKRQDFDAFEDLLTLTGDIASEAQKKRRTQFRIEEFFEPMKAKQPDPLAAGMERNRTLLRDEPKNLKSQSGSKQSFPERFPGGANYDFVHTFKDRPMMGSFGPLGKNQARATSVCGTRDESRYIDDAVETSALDNSLGALMQENRKSRF